MLAATSKETRAVPALFHLALKIVSQDRDLPDRLKFHLDMVIDQALSLLNDPSTINASTLPEAIQLAYELRVAGQRNHNVHIEAGQVVSPQLANRLLALERELAASR